ncbi:MAG TPA: hypothetical protein DCP92_05090 [Nitrospiraceae bacterium]|nr:hypothetical protein [Nitrospiraceae bacterium]
MKKVMVVLLSLLAFVSISESGANASGKGTFTPPPADVAILVCSVTPIPATPPAAGAAALAITVSDYSASSSVVLKTAPLFGDDCATDLAELLNAGLKIRDVQSFGGTILIYTLATGM